MALDEAFEVDHADRVTVVRLNSDNTKLLTAAIDHRVAIYDIDRSTGRRTQLDVFGAHDAEIRDAKWFHARTGTVFITIANDLQARIWTHDPSQAPMSGRRFRKIASIKCEQFVPFVSVDVKTVGTNTYIAIIDRQGLLSLYEPSNPDEFNDWQLVDQLHVCSPTPSRNDHTSFRVVFDQNTFSLPYIQDMSDDHEQLTVAVTALNEFKVYRTASDSNIGTAEIPPRPESSTVGRGASHRLCFFEVLRVQPAYSQALTSAGLLLRDIAFRPGNIRGSDVIAVSSINGTVAVYEVTLGRRDVGTSQSLSHGKYHRPPAQPNQSNLTSALHPSTTSTQAARQVLSRTNHPFQYSHHAMALALLEYAHIDAWSVRWDEAGEMMMSTGSDGTVKIWRAHVTGRASDRFELVGEQAAEDDSDSDDGSFQAVADKT